MAEYWQRFLEAFNIYWTTLVHFISYDVYDVSHSYVVNVVGFDPVLYLPLFLFVGFLSLRDILQNPDLSWKRKLWILLGMVSSIFVFFFLFFIYRLAFH